MKLPTSFAPIFLATSQLTWTFCGEKQKSIIIDTCRIKEVFSDGKKIRMSAEVSFINLRGETVTYRFWGTPGDRGVFIFLSADLETELRVQLTRIEGYMDRYTESGSRWTVHGISRFFCRIV